MNKKDELKSKMDAQRKWRENKARNTVLPAPKRRFSITQFFFFLLVVGVSMATTWALTTSSSKADAAPTPIASTSTPIKSVSVNTNTMTTCAGFEQAKVHVRFDAGLRSDVRGYLGEGETVTFQLNAQGQAITKEVDDVRWIYIESPIQGWVSTSFLCK